MPFDDREFPAQPRLRRQRAQVSIWLAVVAAMIFVMVVLGGATRLTGSGLSIMEWAPLSGTLPPLSDAEWSRLYALYKTIPQYALVNTDFTLADFKHIFWLEWAHRLWGRLLGFAFLAPLVWFVLRGQIERRMVPRLVLLFVLGGLQGAVGWFMVASGFLPDSTSVSAYRLVAHLALALALYGALVWTAISAWPARARAPSPPLPRRLAWATVALVSATIVAGGFVAGTHAGLDYNTFPLMDGSLIPSGYARMAPLVRNLFENGAAVQFDHRLLATVTAVFAVATVASGLRSNPSFVARNALIFLGGAVLVQYALGIATLLSMVRVDVAVTHQAGAVILLTAAIFSIRAMRGGDNQD